MEKKFEDPFLKILPTIDVHGETRDTVIWVIKDFIDTEQKLGHLKIAVIHGRHSNILKKSIHEYLKTYNKVTKYYTYYNNDGITIIELTPYIKLL